MASFASCFAAGFVLERAYAGNRSQIKNHRLFPVYGYAIEFGLFLAVKEALGWIRQQCK